MSDSRNENNIFFIAAATVMLLAAIFVGSALFDLENDNSSNIYKKYSTSSKTIVGENENSVVNKIDINLASYEDLTTVDGIGIDKAKAIIDYRVKLGGFSSLDQLNDVSGIGYATLEKLKQSFYIENELSGNNTESGLININTATISELIKLKGIGEAKAESIINYRQENGPYNSKEDLMNVYGIGQAIFNEIEDDICIK